MNQSPLEILFKTLDETAILLEKELDCSYLDALAETGENIFHDKVLQEGLSEVARKKLDKYYYEISKIAFTKEDVRKAFQLACLKGLKGMHPNHQMTPDSIAFFIGFLIDRLWKKNQPLSLLDPAVGTGNMLSALLNYLDRPIQATGIDVDDCFIRLAYVGANLQERDITLYNQDSLENLFIDPVDMIVCDLPVGYYTNDLRANEFELKADQGHSYAHHLFIEQCIRYTKEGGYIFLLIPNGLFESPEAKKLHSFLKKYVYIQGLFQLPESMFKNKQAAKSIFFIQKKGKEVRPPKEVLLASLPSMQNKESFSSIVAKVENWIEENKGPKASN